MCATTFVICELAQTHEGSLALAKLLVRAAAVAKADAVKVQVFTAAELCVPTYKHNELFTSLEWPAFQWRELIDYSHACGVKIFADVFGVDSMQMLILNGIDGLKIHGTDMRNTSLLASAGRVDLPILLSVGGATTTEISSAVSLLHTPQRSSPIVLMVGFQNYPTQLGDTHLNRLRFLSGCFDLPVGYADHVDGGSSFGFTLCAAAMSIGASYLEKHITIARSLKMEDYESALNPDEFVTFVEKVRQFESTMGALTDNMGPSELAYRRDTRKHVVAAIRIPAGAMIRDTDVALRRADCDAPPIDLEQVIGRIATRDHDVNEVILADGLTT
jgi:N,N'-diacetyllegionaminate synthase